MAVGAIASGFVRKLYRILDQENPRIISWDRKGLSFTIHDPIQLNEWILPKYFRGRLVAFRQQLAAHGFLRILMTRQKLQETYQHPHFRRGCPASLSLIVPRKAAAKEPMRVIECHDASAPRPSIQRPVIQLHQVEITTAGSSMSTLSPMMSKTSQYKKRRLMDSKTHDAATLMPQYPASWIFGADTIDLDLDQLLPVAHSLDLVASTDSNDDSLDRLLLEDDDNDEQINFEIDKTDATPIDIQTMENESSSPFSDEMLQAMVCLLDQDDGG